MLKKKSASGKYNWLPLYLPFSLPVSCLLKYTWNSCLINHNLSNLFWEILLFASIIYIWRSHFVTVPTPTSTERTTTPPKTTPGNLKSWFKRVLELWIGLRHDVYMYVWVLRFQKQVYDFIFLEHRFNSSLIPKEINYWSLYLIVFFFFLYLYSLYSEMYIL